MKLSTTLLGVALFLSLFLSALVGWADAVRALPMDEEIADSKKQALTELESFIQRCDMDEEANEDWEPIVRELLPSLSNNAVGEIAASIRQTMTAGVELCRKLRDASGEAGAQSEPPLIDSKEQKLKELEDAIKTCDNMVDEEANEDWEPFMKELLPSLSNDAVVRVAASFRKVEMASIELCRKVRRE